MTKSNILKNAKFIIYNHIYKLWKFSTWSWNFIVLFFGDGKSGGRFVKSISETKIRFPELSMRKRQKKQVGWGNKSSERDEKITHRFGKSAWNKESWKA